MVRRTLLATLTAVAAGCAGSHASTQAADGVPPIDKLVSRASFDLECDRGKLNVVRAVGHNPTMMGADAVSLVSGCGAHATYVAVRGGWFLANSEVPNAPAVTESTAPAPAPVVAAPPPPRPAPAPVVHAQPAPAPHPVAVQAPPPPAPHPAPAPAPAPAPHPVAVQAPPPPPAPVAPPPAAAPTPVEHEQHARHEHRDHGEHHGHHDAVAEKDKKKHEHKGHHEKKDGGEKEDEIRVVPGFAGGN